MDVRCERCGTEYEFDETLLSPSGTAVRCGQCQFAFRVMAPKPVAGGWVVRRDDGIHVKVPSLADLRARIRRGELAVADLIAREGDAWKPLGDIPELTSTFDSARTVRKPRPEAKPRPNELSTTPFARAEVMTADASSAPVRTDPRLAGSDPQIAAPRTATAKMGGADPRPADPLPPSPTVPARARRDVIESNPPPRSASFGAATARTSAKPRLTLALDEDELPSRKGDSRLGRIGFVVALGTAVAIGLWFRAQKSDRLAERVAATNSATSEFDADAYDHYRSACAALATSHADSPDDVLAVVAISRCHARWAQALEDEASLEPDEPRANSLRDLARAHIVEARRFGDRAVEIDATSPDAHVVLADALRLGANAPLATTELHSAVELGGASAESTRISAEIAASADDDGVAMTSARRAAELAPSDLRVQALLARLALEADDRATLDAALARLRAASPPHVLVSGIEHALAARAVVDAGVPESDRGRR